MAALFCTTGAEATPGASETRPLVVLDPGHGGSNTGAPGVGGEVREKEVTLDLALAVAERLHHLGIDTILTRESDTYLTLRERTRIANRAEADLFVSVHTNATPGHSRRGFETFILTPRALDVDARGLRIGEVTPRSGVSSELAFILDDVERGHAHRQAARVAAEVQREMAEVRGNDRNRGVRQDSMHVLLGANMPAILVEVGFLDHPTEGLELLDPEVQGQIADALARAIARAVSQ